MVYIHHRGRKVDIRKLIERRAKATHRHGAMALDFPHADQVTFFVPNRLQQGDQGQCGSCYLYSSMGVCSDALIAAGVLPQDQQKGFLSPQYGLDCQQFGGCNGGDEGEVIDFVKTHGFPVTSDYGPYRASESSCHDSASFTKYKIKDYGYCDPTTGPNGVASVQSIKNALVKYNNPVSVAGAAGADWDMLSGTQTITGNSQDVNHAIKLRGWDDSHDNGDGSKGAWAMGNQWGAWGYSINGMPGCAWIKYGADAIGTEAIWVDGGSGPVPPPPTPTGNNLVVTQALSPGTYQIPGLGTLTLTASVPAGIYPITQAPPASQAQVVLATALTSGSYSVAGGTLTVTGTVQPGTYSVATSKSNLQSCFAAFMVEVFTLTPATALLNFVGCMFANGHLDDVLYWRLMEMARKLSPGWITCAIEFVLSVLAGQSVITCAEALFQCINAPAPPVTRWLTFFARKGGCGC
jgi:hypothetical protein